MKKLIALISIVGIMLTGCTKAEGGKKVINIGISQIVEYVALDQSREGFMKALEENGYKDGDNIKIEYQNAQGDIAVAQTIGKKYVSQKKDLIFAIATASAQGAYNATKDIPIMITAVTDPIKAGIAKSLDKPETNVSGTSDYLPVEKQLDLIKQLMPKAKKIGVIYNTSEVNSEVQVEELRKAAKDYEIITTGVSSTNDVSSAINSLVKKIDILYVPTDQLVVSSMPIIAKSTLEAKIPIIAAEKGSVEAGALATVGINYYKLGYEAGKMAVEVLKGKDISKMPIKISEETDIYINEDSLKALGIPKPKAENIQYIKTK
ncbi:ABC transporter substrate-binding protein [Desnuesiella massiliensis]|uniref:ABC transporter substrate-binding protein n=1 Tax=Desnuesiella massiliensis TaxID=1650662 RepID=UPI0006E340B5|nr:ABC transporter substrate-binding protein [Desnuesiella massiliensis]